MTTIRPERTADEDAIARVVAAAFESHREARIVARLRAARSLALSLVADTADGDDARVIGHIAFSAVAVDHNPQSLTVMALGPLAVAPCRQNRGIGSGLVAAGLSALADAVAAVVVLGHPAYYPRFGFGPAGASELTFEDRPATPAFMVLERRPGALRGLSGPVRYHPAFGEG